MPVCFSDISGEDALRPELDQLTRAQGPVDVALDVEEAQKHRFARWIFRVPAIVESLFALVSTHSLFVRRLMLLPLLIESDATERQAVSEGQWAYVRDPSNNVEFVDEPYLPWLARCLSEQPEGPFFQTPLGEPFTASAAIVFPKGLQLLPKERRDLRVAFHLPAFRNPVATPKLPDEVPLVLGFEELTIRKV